LTQLVKTRQQMNELGYTPDPAPAVMYFLTARLSDKEVADMRKLMPRKDLIESWGDLEDNAKELAKRLNSKEAATPSRTWKLLSEARPEMILFLSVTARQQGVIQKLKNFFTKWRQVQQKIPLPEMAELFITPQLPEYPKIAHDVHMLLLDGRLRSRTEILKFLKPLAPPPPPPPPPPKRGRGAKAAAAAAAVPALPAPVAGKKKGRGTAAAVPNAAPAPAQKPVATKGAAKSPAGATAASPKAVPKPPVVKPAAKQAKKEAPKKSTKPAAQKAPAKKNAQKKKKSR
jgi:tRNA nucleotidyltransferase (CCA-adding enzyme)